MADKLKIYACSGIGAAQAEKPVAYWTDNTKTISNTQAVNSLLAAINGDYIKYSRLRGLTKANKIELLNEIDLLTVCLDAAQRYSGKPEKLHNAGLIIGEMIQNGLFDCDSLDENKRDNNLDELIDAAHALYGEEPKIEVSQEFMTWWSETVEKRDKVGLTAEQQSTIEETSKTIKGIGAADDAWMKNADLAEYLTKGGTYFLYCYFSPEQLAKLPQVFKKKQTMQYATYNYCKALFVNVYGSEEAMQEIIRASIIDQFQATPEQVCADIVAGKREAIGLATEVIVAIIGALTTLIVGVITAVCTMVAQTNVAKYAAVDRQAVESSTPNEDDFNGLSLSGSGATSWLPLAAIGIGLLFLLKS